MKRLKKMADLDNIDNQINAVKEAIKQELIVEEIKNAVEKATESILEKADKMDNVEQIAEDISYTVMEMDGPYESIAEYLDTFFDLDADSDMELQKLVLDYLQEEAYEYVDFDKIEKSLNEETENDDDVKREYWDSRF